MARDGDPLGPGGGRGGDWDEGEDKSLTAAAKAGLAVGLLAALTVLGILGVHVWRRTSPSRFWELEGVGRGDGGAEGEGLERPTAADAVAAMAALDERNGWQHHQHRGCRTHVRGSASAPHLYDGDGGVEGVVGEGRPRSLRRGVGGDGEEVDEEEEQEIPIDEDHYRHHHQARRHSGAGAAAGAASSSSMRRSRSASLPSRVSMGSARGRRHSPPSEEPGRVMRSGSDESSLTSHSGSEEGGNNSDPESRGRNFEMV